MRGFACPACGHLQTIAELTDADSNLPRCASCGAPTRIIVDGVRTIAHPGSTPLGAETVFTGSGTLDLEAPESEGGAIDTVVRAALVVRGAGVRNGRVPLTGSRTTIGRASADILVEDPALSSSHFEIEAIGDNYFLHDLESSNGTILNERRIRSAELAHGDVIRAGATTFTFTLLVTIRTEDPSD